MKYPVEVFVNEGVAISHKFSALISYYDSCILTQSSSDTVYRFLPDYSTIPFMVRKPSIQSMSPEVFLFPRMITDRYYFMSIVKKEYDFASAKEYPTTNLVYDSQERKI